MIVKKMESFLTGLLLMMASSSVSPNGLLLGKLMKTRAKATKWIIRPPITIGSRPLKDGTQDELKKIPHVIENANTF